jgi:hypothetical protein
MAGQVDEWVDLPNTSKTECTEQYNRALRTASSENFLTDKEIKYRFNLNNGVRLVSSKSNILNFLLSVNNVLAIGILSVYLSLSLWKCFL